MRAEEALDVAAEMADALRKLDLKAVLVGGMALVVLGSRRVTRDFDFLVEPPGNRLDALVDAFYQRGFQLASRLDAAGDIATTIDNRRVAAARLRIDAPPSAYFYNPETGQRIDLLFDFPVPAAEVAARATRMKIASHVLDVAAEADLLELKRIAAKARHVAGDADDIAFLEARLRATAGGKKKTPRKRTKTP